VKKSRWGVLFSQKKIFQLGHRPGNRGPFKAYGGGSALEGKIRGKGHHNLYGEVFKTRDVGGDWGSGSGLQWGENRTTQCEKKKFNDGVERGKKNWQSEGKKPYQKKKKKKLVGLKEGGATFSLGRKREPGTNLKGKKKGVGNWGQGVQHKNKKTEEQKRGAGGVQGWGGTPDPIIRKKKKEEKFFGGSRTGGGPLDTAPAG